MHVPDRSSPRAFAPAASREMPILGAALLTLLVVVSSLFPGIRDLTALRDQDSVRQQLDEAIRVRVKKKHAATVGLCRGSAGQAISVLAEQYPFNAASGAVTFDGFVERSTRWAIGQNVIGLALALLIAVVSRRVTTPSPGWRAP